MNKVFGDRERFYYLYQYLDDMLISSRSFEEHKDHLTTVFETLRINSLVLNPTKTAVAYENLEFLGFDIGKDGIKIANSTR